MEWLKRLRNLLAALFGASDAKALTSQKILIQGNDWYVPPKAIAPGRLLKNRYRIEEKIGKGGIAVVYLARDTEMHDRPVVIKVLLDEVATSTNSEWIAEKFDGEIKALARIDHPGVVGVLDTGKTASGKAFIVLQFIEGSDLRAAMKSGAMDHGRVAALVRQMGQALSAAHSKGVIHRDLKPENIMLNQRDDAEHVTLIDFGIATIKDSTKPENAGQPEAPLHTKVAGTPQYMAPEQLRGEPVNASDIYALGVIAYEMLTGELPFKTEEVVVLHRLQEVGLKTPAATFLDLPTGAQEIILKALSFKAEDRPPSPREFGEKLAFALTSQAPSLETAHVLIADIVGYSKLPMSQQKQCLEQLQAVVRKTSAFQRALDTGDLKCLPTGDGMALVFFRDSVASAKCAEEIARALRSYPELKLRMGIHVGPVYRVDDINDSLNVAGGGINLAQRVMDCGDAGHILLSKTAADILLQLGNWEESLHDLGEHEVKHGVRIHLFSLYAGEVGNPEWPEKLDKLRRRETIVPIDTAAKRIALLYKRHAQPDEELLRLLETRLTEHGYRVFIDRHLAIGVEWAQEIERQVRTADAVIPLLSAASVTSEMLAYEVQIAHDAAQQQQGKPRLLPVRVNFEDALPDPLNAILDPIQQAYWRGAQDDDSVCDEILNALVTAPDPQARRRKLEPVGGAVPLSSQFYIVRPTDDDFQAALERRDSLVLVKGAADGQDLAARARFTTGAYSRSAGGAHRFSKAQC